MQLHFNSISELGKPGPKWQTLFYTHWPAYKFWLDSKKNDPKSPSLKVSIAALKTYMPEMLPTYNRLCKLVNADDTAARFLTGYQPPMYLNGCAQAVVKGKDVCLIRNYDYHPELIEGTQLMSSWNAKRVIATSDCLIGALDGINEDGLAISLSFGGRKVEGIGFGIPFILRYVLEFCSNVEEATKALCRIPAHMAYNVTLVDKSRIHKTVQLAPDKTPVVTDANFATNHQGPIDWPENAVFNKTLERSAFLEQTLLLNKMDPQTVLKAFLSPPLYNTRFSEGFGTLYTAVYSPKKGSVDMYWPGQNVTQDFENFKEMYLNIDFVEIKDDSFLLNSPLEADGWQEKMATSRVNAMAKDNPEASQQQLDDLRQSILQGRTVSLKKLSSFWEKPIRKHSKIDKK